MADIFISYKKADRARVEGLVQDLEAEGFTVWWDYEIGSGENWLDRILKEVDVARCVVGVWTRTAIGANGMFVASGESGINYVRIEHERGARKLAPAVLEDTPLPVQFSDLQTSDLRTWTPGDRAHPGFRSLVEQVEALATPSWVRARLTGLEARLVYADTRRTLAEQRAATMDAVTKEEADRVARQAEEVTRAAPALDRDRRDLLEKLDATEALESAVKEAEARAAQTAVVAAKEALRARAAEEKAKAASTQPSRGPTAPSGAPWRTMIAALVLAGFVGVGAFSVGNSEGWRDGRRSGLRDGSRSTSIDSFVGDWVRVSGTCGTPYQRLSKTGSPDIIWEFSSDGRTWTKDKRSGSASVSGDTLSLSGTPVMYRAGGYMKRLSGCDSGSTADYRRFDALDMTVAPKTRASNYILGDAWTKLLGVVGLVGDWSPGPGCTNKQRFSKSDVGLLWQYKTPSSSAWQTDSRGGAYTINTTTGTVTFSSGVQWKLTNSGASWGGCNYTRIATPSPH